MERAGWWSKDEPRTSTLLVVAAYLVKITKIANLNQPKSESLYQISAKSVQVRNFYVP